MAINQSRQNVSILYPSGDCDDRLRIDLCEQPGIGYLETVGSRQVLGEGLDGCVAMLCHVKMVPGVLEDKSHDDSADRDERYRANCSHDRMSIDVTFACQAMR